MEHIVKFKLLKLDNFSLIFTDTDSAVYLAVFRLLRNCCSSQMSDCNSGVHQVDIVFAIR